MNRAKYYLMLVCLLLAVVACPLAVCGEPPTDSSGLATTKPEDSQSGQAYCGISVSPLDPVLTAQLPDVTEKGRGVVVAKVLKGSPAEQAGIKQYDIVITYDDQDIYSPEQLVKLVRNDRPGREVAMTYVRGGKVHKATLKLGEMTATTEVRDKTAQDEQAHAAQSEHANRAWRRQNNPRPWATFESLTVTKLSDGRYRAAIEFRDRDQKLLQREFSGTREEIRKAIEQDKELPADEREHLLRSLDQQAPRMLPFNIPGELQELFDLDRELFNWPNLNF